MLTSQEHKIGKLVVNRFRERRADQINAEMVQRGSLWFDNFITNTPILDIFSVLIPNLRFGTGIRDFKDFSNKNYRAILQSIGKLNHEEQLFFSAFLTSNFYVCHATNSQEVINSSHDLVLFSRKKLIEDGIKFNTENTTKEDISGLANDDNIFFSLEIGIPPQKMPIGGKGSRFGNNIYKIPLTNHSFDFSSLYLFDQLEMDIPNCRISGISEEAKKILSTRRYSRKSICFYGRKSIPALALSTIAAARLLSENDRSILLSARTDKEKNDLLRYLFRVEIRVPRIVGIKYGSYYRFNFGG
ncbi:hypothetical protein [Citrobacter cronae]|uniref:hypothetical protein n=1 Tax=Citrobacter cronae TaxID=1748967 RepID=UPI001C0FF79A|nr:hypothetical protein [Citrobacter cronae]MBU5388974.1 hypothetical protein [Citrobacter cronae]